jgi:hypothetical protein
MGILIGNSEPKELGYATTFSQIHRKILSQDLRRSYKPGPSKYMSAAFFRFYLECPKYFGTMLSYIPIFTALMTIEAVLHVYLFR